MSFQVGEFLEALFGHEKAAGDVPFDTVKAESSVAVEIDVDDSAAEGCSMASGGDGIADEMVDATNPWPEDEAQPRPEPCPECRTLEMWETMTGRWRCMRCDPPRAAVWALGRAARLRRRHGLPDPEGMEERK